MSFKPLSRGLLDRLTEKATQSPRSRQHYNIHVSYQDPCQKLLNAVGMDSYIRPHRHALDPKDECLVAARGLFAVIVFTEQGEVQSVDQFGTERYYRQDPAVSFGIQLHAGSWHTVLALAPESLLLEMKAGPFNPNAAKEFAPWAPEEGTAEAEEYFLFLRSLL